jgi:hypothetical protein
MNNRIKTLGLLAVAALSVVALAQDAIQLKRTVKAGEVTKYMIKADFNFGGTDASFSSVAIETVKKVDENGNFTIESKSSDAKVVVGGQENALPDNSSVTTTFKPTGEVLDVKADGANGPSGRIAAMQATYFPTKPIKVGDSWDVDVKPDTKLGSVGLKGTFKLEAAEKVGDFDTYRIKESVKEASGTTPWTNEGTVWISVKDGSLVKEVGNWKNAPLNPQGDPLDAKFTVLRDGVKG